ncbi:uncharacterized protein J3D65DRAFT_655102 [Phyllosticta citribraziliensis]|uniref:Uncharacterized protein n=1 Tax=Phyllosticta citribraziliensis TaxID=989973 RepID=A0ABR1ME61_9PEZI
MAVSLLRSPLISLAAPHGVGLFDQFYSRVSREPDLRSFSLPFRFSRFSYDDQRRSGDYCDSVVAITSCSHESGYCSSRRPQSRSTVKHHGLSDDTVQASVKKPREKRYDVQQVPIHHLASDREAERKLRKRISQQRARAHDGGSARHGPP